MLATWTVRDRANPSTPDKVVARWTTSDAAKDHAGRLNWADLMRGVPPSEFRYFVRSEVV